MHFYVYLHLLNSLVFMHSMHSRGLTPPLDVVKSSLVTSYSILKHTLSLNRFTLRSWKVSICQLLISVSDMNVIFQVSAEQKSVGSTSGMHTSVETSQLLKVQTIHHFCLSLLGGVF